MPRMKNPDQSLLFPLNVYSALMRHYAGRVPFLSYGSLAAEDLQALTVAASHGAAVSGSAGQAPAAIRPERLAGMMIEAQWRRADQIIDRVQALTHSAAIPADAEDLVVTEAAPALRVLEVGCGSGELARMLAELGHDVCATDISADAFNITLADEDMPGSLEFVCCDFQAFEDVRGFDLLIFNNSTRYFLPLTLFYKAQLLLKPGGQILICEEFASNKAVAPDPDSLPVLDHVLALAERLGFDVLSVDDLTAGTINFQQVFIQLFGLALDDLPALTDTPVNAINDLYQALQADKLAAEQGRRRHVLVSLRAGGGHSDDGSTDPVYLRSAGDFAPEAFKNVFERSFDTEFLPDLWAWKYRPGKAASVVAERNGEAIAHYGGAVRDIFYFAQPARAAQICDVMVMPDERGFFSRNGLFFKTAASMLEQYVGYRADNLLGFGFPNIKAMHVAERLGLYEKTDELLQLAADSKTLPWLGSDWQLQVVDFVTAQRHINTLWPQMLSGFRDAIIGVRDGDYLHYRYWQRPRLQYECLQLTVNTSVRAIVFRRPHYDGYLVMDIIAAAEDLPLALHAVLQPSDEGKRSVFWVTGGQLNRVQFRRPQSSRQPDTGDTLQVSKTGIQIPCNRWTRGPYTATLAGKWWLTAGDMDFL